MEGTRPGLSGRRYTALLSALVLAGALLRLLPLVGPIEVIDGRTIPDDAYLSATLARNIGWGEGPVYGSEPTNGYQPLHVLVSALLWLGDDEQVRAAPTVELLDLRVRQAIGVVVLFDLLAILLVASLLRTRYGGGGEALAGAAVWALHPTCVHTALNGMETSLAATAVLGALVLWQARVRGSPRLAWRALLGAVLGLAVLARVDAGILAACLVGFELVDGRRQGRAVGRTLAGLAVIAGVATLVVLPWLAWSWSWTGALYPISGEAVRLNALSWKAREGIGALFWLRSVGSCLGSIIWLNAPVLWPAAIVTVGIAGWKRRRSRAWARALLTDLASWPLALSFVGALFAAYTLWVLAWWFNHRYMYAAMLLPILVLAAGLSALRGSRWRGRVTALVVLACLVHPLHWGVWSGRADPDLGYRNVGLWVRDRFEPGESVGSCQSGAIGYYNPGLQVWNLDGVVSPSALTALKQQRALAHLEEVDVDTLVAWGGCVHYLASRSRPGARPAFRRMRVISGFQSWNRSWRVYRVEPERLR